MEAHSHQGSR